MATTTSDAGEQFPEKPAIGYVSGEVNIPRLPSGRIDADVWARQLGIEPIHDLEEFADIWPEGESIDDFLATLRGWRTEGRS